MSGKPQTGGLAVILRQEKERRASEDEKSESRTPVEKGRVKRMKVTDAVKYLCTSKGKIRELVKEGVLTCEDDPLDKRRKLLRVDELKKLKQASLDRD